MGTAQALRILEDHCIVPRDDVERDSLFAAFAALHLLTLGADSDA